MATKVVRTDDIDGTDATHQVSIIVDGSRCNLDLGDANFATFQTDIKKYLDLADAKKERQRKAATTTAPKKRSGSEPTGKIVITMPDGTPIDKDAARMWAKDNGYPKIGFFVGPSVLEEYRDHLVALLEGKAGESEPEEESDDQE